MGFSIKEMTSIKLPFVVRCLLSKRFTFAATLFMASLQLIALLMMIRWSLVLHFYMLRDKRCIPFSIASPLLCFLIKLMPASFIVPFLSGFALWPFMVLVTAVQIYYSGRWTKMPIFSRQITKIQKKYAEKWLHSIFDQRMRTYLHEVTLRYQQPPIDVLLMIVKQVEQAKLQLIHSVLESLSEKRKSRFRMRFLETSLWSNDLLHTSGYIVFVDRRQSQPHEEVWYAVFSKDVAVFTLLCLIQISLPYWLYHL